MKSDWFGLPGPARFLDDVFKSLSEPRNMIVLIPEKAVEPVMHVLKNRLVENGDFDPLCIIRAENCPTVDDILLRSCPEGDSDTGGEDYVIGNVLRHLRNKVLLVAVENAHVDDWATFLRERYLPRIRGGREPEAPTLCLLIASNEWECTKDGVFRRCGGGNEIKNEVCFCCRSLDGRITRNDVEAFVAHYASPLMMETLPWFRELQAAVVAGIGKDNLEFVEYLASLEWKNLDDPDTILAGYTGPRTDPLFDEHGNHDPEEWKRRLWKGQVRELFPMLEEMRLYIIKTAQAKNILKKELTKNIRGEIYDEHIDPLELDFGDVPHNIKDNGEDGRRLRSFAKTIHKIRVEIAHLKPYPLPDLAQGSEFYKLVTVLMRSNML